MSNAKPAPNLLRFGFGDGDGFMGVDARSLFFGGDPRYVEEAALEIGITDENRSELVAALRTLANFIEAPQV